MGKFDVRTIDIPLDELENIDDMFFRQIQMRREKAMKKFSAQVEETRERIFSNVKAQGIFLSCNIAKVEGDDIHLEGGVVITNNLLADLFRTSEEMVFCAITVHGYDVLEEKAKDGFDMLFLDGWGTAVAECGHVWMKDRIREELEQDGFYCTSSWSPGQHNVDIKLQKELFAVLHPEEIGITLGDSFMMHPKKSISSFIGVSRDKDVQQMRSCDFCPHRDTCPSAYV